jgi:protein O-GlcNAc transferase
VGSAPATRDFMMGSPVGRTRIVIERPLQIRYRLGGVHLGKRSRERQAQRATRDSVIKQAGDTGTLQRARTLHSAGRLAEAEALYQDLLRREPDHPEATHLLGVLALQCGQPEAAVALISRTLELDPGNAQAHANLGSALLTLKRWEEALAHYDGAQKLNPQFVGVHHNRGTALQMLGRQEEAARSFERLLGSIPDADFVLGNLVHSRSHTCDWRDLEEHTRRLVAGVRAGRRIARSFAFLSVSSAAADQLQCARTYTSYVMPRGVAPLWKGERYSHDRIRIAYVSADFRDHIVSHLMAPIYERHDGEQFQTIGVAVAGSDDSPVIARSKRALGEFVDVTDLSDADAARKLRELEIDIAVDLSGYTLGGRPGIFAHRPAPVQVNYLGYPGTMGGPHMDYILADDFVIPLAQRPFYAEKIASLPETFQANDERRALGADLVPPTRAAAGLGESGAVLCCFNNSYKLNPTLFALWMRVLQAAPDAVLWLLAAEPVVERRLREEAVKRGVSAERLVFAPRVPYADHIARLKLADLYLDTLPFNGGASASDALWAGLPVVTTVGEAFASRMAGSLLCTLGLSELVTNTLEDYERVATEIATDSKCRTTYRQRLLERRGVAPLFDGHRFCRHLEQAYRVMWERSQRGEPPTSFKVEPLVK